MNIASASFAIDQSLAWIKITSKRITQLKRDYDVDFGPRNVDACIREWIRNCASAKWPALCSFYEY